MNTLAAVSLAISLDYGSTKYALSQGAIESNPIVASNLEVTKATEVVILTVGIREIEKRNKKAAKWTKIGLFVVHGIIGIHNIRTGMKAK